MNEPVSQDIPYPHFLGKDCKINFISNFVCHCVDASSIYLDYKERIWKSYILARRVLVPQILLHYIPIMNSQPVHNWRTLKPHHSPRLHEEG